MSEFESADLDWLISVDDHLIEAPDVWTSQASAADRDRVPHVVEEDGRSLWVYEDLRIPVPGTIAHAGRPVEEVVREGMSYTTMRRAYFEPAARVEDMDRDGVIASLGFPFFPRYCGQTFYEAKDRELAAWCLRAYNDWVIDGWSAAAPGRFLPLVIVPLWDPQAAVREIERTAAKGAKAISFSENPSKLGLPSIHDRDGYWEPVFAAANDTGLPLAIHFGSSSTVPTTSDDAPYLVSGTLAPISLAYCMTDWIWSGILPRYENLRLLMSEGGIGWIPYMLERCRNVVRDHDRTNVLGDHTPWDLFQQHIYGCFIDDEYGCKHLAEVGFDNVMIETDYPHGDGTFPHSRENVRKLLAGYPDEVVYKVVQGNARRLFDYTPPPYPS